MTNTPDEPLGDEEMQTSAGPGAGDTPLGSDGDSTDADGSDGDSTDASDGDATSGGSV